MGKKTTRLVAIVSDTHCGSTCSVCPPDFVTKEGQVIGHNPIQKWIWECWLDCWREFDQLRGDDPFILVINGDSIEGNHHKTREIISADPGDHQAAAIQLFEPIAKKASKTFVVEGTECHTGTSESDLAKALKAVADPNTQKRAWERLPLDICGVRCVFQHHITVSIRPWTKGTGLSVALAAEQVYAAKNNEVIPRVLCSAHRHEFDTFRDASSLATVNPAWQALTRHGRKVVGSARFKPGIVALDWRRKKDGQLPDIEAIIRAAPEAKAAQV